MGTTVQLVLLLLCALAGQSLGQSSSLTSKTSNCQTYCWTKWLDRDNPSGTGDYENLVNFPSNQVCPKPVGIECRTTAGAPYQSTGEYFAVNCEPRKGLVCKKSEQPDGACHDYRVRFLCPHGTIQDTTGITCRHYCHTQWLDRDNPSGYCDCETLRDFDCSQTCRNPVGVRCRDKNTALDYQSVGQNMFCNARDGGVCWNSDNNSPCKDYEVQFICPCDNCVLPKFESFVQPGN